MPEPAGAKVFLLLFFQKKKFLLLLPFFYVLIDNDFMTTSIKDVARAAGVSPATVSRALGAGPVSPELKAQVEAAVLRTGYRPNLSARRLRSQHSQTIGLIVADISNPFFTAVARAVEDAAYQAGLRVILCNTDENPEREALYLQLMEEERVTGVIFAPTRATVDRLRGNQPYPIVLIDRAGAAGGQDAVVLDNFAAAAALVDHLFAQGFRRITGLFGNASTTGIERHAGYDAAMRRLGLAPDQKFIPPSTQAAEAEVASWFAGGTAPEAVIASNGLLLMGVVRAIRAAGLAIPNDLAVAGFDNETWTELIGPGLTVIEQPVAEIGRTAMQLLLARLATPAAPTRKITLGGTCIIRGSTKKSATTPNP
jgi:LacI family fructose operon transcriptional repressor